MRQHGVAIATLGGQILSGIGQTALGHGHWSLSLGPRTLHHGGHGGLAAHQLEFVERRQDGTEEGRVVVFRHLPGIKNVLFDQVIDQFLVLVGTLGHVLEHLNQHVELSSRHF